jgi:hypothetical protein
VVESRDGVLAKPFQATDGRVEVPKGPGLGVEVDKKMLRRYAKRYFVMDRKRLVLFALRDRGLKAAREIDAAKKARLGR